MNNRGITTIELITSFVLASVIFVILFNVVLMIKDVYSENGIKTELLINQANLSTSLNEKINNDHTLLEPSFNYDSEKEIYTYIFNVDGEDISLNICIKENNQYISFNNYTYELSDKVYIDTPIINDGIKIGDSDFVYTVGVTDEAVFNTMLVIDIPIKSKKVDGNYGVKVVYQYFK